MDRSPEVEQLAVAWLAGMKAGDAVAVASLFVENEATTVIGNGADQWFTDVDAYTLMTPPPSRASRSGQLADRPPGPTTCCATRGRSADPRRLPPPEVADRQRTRRRRRRCPWPSCRGSLSRLPANPRRWLRPKPLITESVRALGSMLRPSISESACRSFQHAALAPAAGPAARGTRRPAGPDRAPATQAAPLPRAVRERPTPPHQDRTPPALDPVPGVLVGVP